MATFTLLGGRLTLEDTPPRPPEDALWLAAGIPGLPAGTRVLDAACGNGVAALALLTRQPRLHLTAVDIDPALTALALRNAALNRHNITAITADVLTPLTLPPFAAILCNPPFYPAENHPASATKALAKSLPAGQLAAWLAALMQLLAPTGTLHLVLHTQCQPQLLAFAQAHALALTITPLQTTPKTPAKRFLATLQRATGHTLTTHPPLAIHAAALREHVLSNGNALA